jgi:hypothetical protein
MMCHPDGKQEYLAEFTDSLGKEIVLVPVAESDLEVGEAIVIEEDLRDEKRIWDAGKYMT